MKHGEVRQVTEEFLEWLADQGIYLTKPDPDDKYESYPPDEDFAELAQRFARERRKGKKQ